MECSNKLVKQEYEILQALYDFTATVAHTLSFKKEELFIFHSGNIISRNWWSVINCNGKLGYIPSNYVAVTKASRGKMVSFINTAIETLSSDISKGGTDKQLELMKELISRKQELVDRKHRIPSVKEKLTTSKSLPSSEKQEEIPGSPKDKPDSSETSFSLKTSLSEYKFNSVPNERLENYEVKCLVESAPQNAYMLVQQVRNLTGLSQEKSRIAVGVVAEGLIDILSASVHPSLELFLELLHKDITPSEEILDGTLDARNLRRILSHLTAMKEDAQQRSWHLWDDEATIKQNISELSSILSDADPMICRRVLMTANYEDVNMLVAYYQMEERNAIRQLLIQTFAIMCSLDEIIISILLNSVLPMELAREMQSNISKPQCLSKPAMLLSMIFSLGEAMPITHLDHLGIDFIKNILLVIEAENSTEISDLLLTLLLSYNLQFKPKAVANITVQAVMEAPSVKTFTEKVLLLINREEDPITKLKTHETPYHSVLKLLNDLFSYSATAKLFYTNDVKVLIDIIVRQITDLTPHNKKRTEYLELCKLIMYTCDDTAFEHRLDDLNSLFSRILFDEVPEVPEDRYLVREIKEALPQYFAKHSPQIRQ
ncbi:NCK-interacting protein with SH3 domain isoform X2 [Rhodnius prolixus]|uniref:NCK-interacting protein with SH3 domain isoform X2 n=1 Tax=Rhodnius prolixus TaxID=13249 RepID=UPI003D18EF4F